MQLSGLGPAGLLSQHQVPVAVDLPGVGENLQDHLQLRTVYRVRGARTVNTLYRNWITRAGMGLQYLLLRSGPLTMPPSTLGAFAKSDPALASPDLEWHVQPCRWLSSVNRCIGSGPSLPRSAISDPARGGMCG